MLAQSEKVFDSPHYIVVLEACRHDLEVVIKFLLFKLPFFVDCQYCSINIV